MRKRNRRVEFRLTEEEYAHFRDKAAKSGLPVGTFLRHAVDGVAIQEAPPVEFYALIRELKRIGANLDQLLKQTYTYHRQDSAAVYAVLSEIRRTQAMLWDSFFPQSKWQ